MAISAGLSAAAPRLTIVRARILGIRLGDGHALELIA